MASGIARALRRSPTEAERRLWSRLRHRQFVGLRFRRQVPLGRSVVDFACLSKRLLVEVDGGQHDWLRTRDATRTAWLEANGFRVVRFWNNEVLGNIDGVLERLRELLIDERAAAPPPRSSATRGEGALSVAPGVQGSGAAEPDRGAPARTLHLRWPAGVGA